MANAAGEDKKRLRDLVFKAALCAHILAWVAFLVLAFAPVYQGVSVTATAASSTASSGEMVPSQPVRVTSTLIEVNGWYVLPIVVAPVAISGAGLLGVLLAVPGSVPRRLPLGLSALLLLGFCVAGSFSIGMFYLTAALAMGLSAALGLVQRRQDPSSA